MEKRVVVLDYGMGNVGSVANMVKKVGHHAVLTADHSAIRDATHLILPGVGHFATGMSRLEDLGLVSVLNEARSAGKAILGICLGMQLMTKSSQEGNRSGLGWFDVETRRFPTNGKSGPVRVPHLGWNLAHPTSSQGVLSETSRFYFVHSYFVEISSTPDCVATTQYGDIEFASAIADRNVLGVQFHPEKSHRHGREFFERFFEA